jgi:hypothetical protein
MTEQDTMVVDMLDHKHLIVFLALIIFSLSVFAAVPDINHNTPTTGTIINGGSTITLDFNVIDYNAELNPGSPPAVTFYWSTTSGTRTNTILLDRNLYDGLLVTCTDYNFYESQKCQYSWNVPGASSIASNSTIYVDYNFTDYNGTAWTTVFASSGALTVYQPMSSSMCSMMNLIPFALLAGLVIAFCIMFFAFKGGASPVDSLISVVSSFVVVLVIAIIIYTMIGQVCVL